MEIAAYVFSANVRIGHKYPQPHYTSGQARALRFHINVRDYDFWMQQDVKDILERLLFQETGGDEYSFCFYKMQPGAAIDKRPVWNPFNEEQEVILFSGGLDSVAGLIEQLETTAKKVILVSHQAGLPEIALTQNKLFSIISNFYPDRCSHFRFQCDIPNILFDDKTVRSRSLLYNTAAFILASLHKRNEIYVYENGISALGFDQVYSSSINSAGRQYHPKTLGLMSRLFSRVMDDEFTIKQPFLFKTKADVTSILRKYNKA